MTHWEIYTNLINQDGENQRLRTINRTKKEFLKKSKNSPAYKEVLVDGKKQNVLIISSSTELDIKKIVSMPNEIIGIGSIVEWNNEHWIVYDNDCEDSIYQVGRMYRCNVYLKWQNEKGEMSEDFNLENESINLALKFFTELKLFAGILYVSGFPVAFTIASRISSECVDIHFEKAVSDYSRNGAFAVINQLFVQNFSDYKYINREEDMNIEGLRKAKLSYKPELILEKFYFL